MADIAWDWEQACSELVAVDPALAPVLAAAPPPVFREVDPLQHLVRAVCAQQLSVKAATTIEGRLRAACGGQVSAAALAALSEAEMRGAGLSRAKTRTLSALAQADLEGSLAARSLRGLSDADVAGRLCALPGIGPWTAEVFLLFALHRQDILPVADLGLRDAAARLRGGRVPLSAANLGRMGEAWRPWRSAVAIGLWAWRRAAV